MTFRTTASLGVYAYSAHKQQKKMQDNPINAVIKLLTSPKEQKKKQKLGRKLSDQSLKLTTQILNESQEGIELQTKIKAYRQSAKSNDLLTLQQTLVGTTQANWRTALPGALAGTGLGDSVIEYCQKAALKQLTSSKEKSGDKKPLLGTQSKGGMVSRKVFSTATQAFINYTSNFNRSIDKEFEDSTKKRTKDITTTFEAASAKYMTTISNKDSLPKAKKEAKAELKKAKEQKKTALQQLKKDKKEFKQVVDALKQSVVQCSLDYQKYKNTEERGVDFRTKIKTKCEKIIGHIETFKSAHDKYKTEHHKYKATGSGMKFSPNPLPKELETINTEVLGALSDLDAIKDIEDIKELGNQSNC